MFKQTTNSDGDLILKAKTQVAGEPEKAYRFREPLGKDLIPISRAVEQGLSEPETLALTLATLSKDGYSSDYFLELKAAEFNAIGKHFGDFFRVSMQ